MANKKITELNAASSLAATDVVPVVDVSADETKKITATDLFRTLPDGTAAAPALAFSSDQANGVYLAGTDTVGISTGGTQRVTVDGSGNVTISGDLTVSGATTTVESTTVTIDDKNIELGSVASPSNTTADGGGITLKGATDKTLKWINSTGCWTFNQPMNFNDHVRIDSSGRIGIGTTSPSQLLHLNGTNPFIYVEADSTTGNSGITFADGANKGQIMYHHDGDYMRFSTNGSSNERLRIDSSGNVGIGTASPSRLLEIKSSAPIIRLTESTNTYSEISANSSVLSLKADEGNGAGSTRIDFRVDGSEAMRINSSGNVGIGTTSPSNNLDIAVGANSEGINIGGSGNFFGLIEFDANRSGADQAIGDIAYKWNGTRVARIIGGTGSDTTNKDDGALQFHTASAGSATEKVRIDGSGRVGIGTSSPGQLLQVGVPNSATGSFRAGTSLVSIDAGYQSSNVIGTAAAPALIFGGDSNTGYWHPASDTLAVSTAGSERLRIDSSGRLLLGTTTEGVGDADEFTVATSGSTGITIRSGTSNSGNLYFSDGTSGDAEYRGYINYDHGNDRLNIGTSATPRLSINSNGAWGIEGASNYGTSGQVLTSNGNDSPTWQDASGGGASAINDLSDAVTNSSGATIGLGTGALANDDGTTNHNTAVGKNALNTNTTGAYNVAVGSLALDANTTANNNTAVGYNSLSTNTTGASNTAIGLQALHYNTTGQHNAAVGKDAGVNITTGQKNVVVGSEALYTNTTGDQNVSIGYNSLFSNTTANNNTAVGHNALFANTTGTDNTAVGSLSLDANTTGSSNTGLGYRALGANTTGNANIAVGDAAMITNTTGAQNVAVGIQALEKNNADNNTAVGYQALEENTSGAQNTAIGVQALDENTTASENTAVGYATLGVNTTGANNTALGSRTLNANTTGSSNVAVGYNSAPATTTGIRNVAIGQSTLAGNTTQSQNVAVGHDALNSATASNNCAVGYKALASNTTGTRNSAFGTFAMSSGTVTAHDNTAVGYYALVNNSSGASNTAVGKSALSSNTTASNNTAVGINSLSANTTGAVNVALGVEALANNTTASNNVAVGYNALNDNTTGVDNTAIGALALDANTTASYNNAFGKSALSANTTGSFNHAFGNASMIANTTGSSNVAMGYNSLGSNTIGGNNVAIGHQALNANTASNNTSIGYNSLVSNTSGHSNVGVGSGALDVNTTGNNNVAVGKDAGGANTTGYENVAVGQGALIANTTGARNTALGRNALDACVTGGTNVALGYNALSNYTQNNNVAIGGDAAKSTTTGGQNTVVGDAAARDGSGYIHCTLIGAEAGKSNTAHEITAVGYQALKSNTGGDNTAVGYQALDANTSGYNNAAVGFGAGGGNTTGVANTFVGKNAGLNNITGSQNICIGLNTGTLSGAGSNQIVLGINIDSVGSNYFTFGKSNNRVYNNFSSNASWTRSSDVRLKKDIQTNTDLGLGFINDLRTVTYKWKAPSELDSALPGYNADKTEAEYSNKMYGFIAQEVKQALDDHNVTDFAGWTTDNEGVQGISYEMFVMPLVKAVQELSAENVALKARLDAAGI